MPEPIPFAISNGTLSAPQGMDCLELPVFRDGRQCVSCWQFTTKELETLNANGGRLWVTVIGMSQAPMVLSTDSPFLNMPHAVDIFTTDPVVQILRDVALATRKLSNLENRVHFIQVRPDIMRQLLKYLFGEKSLDDEMCALFGVTLVKHKMEPAFMVCRTDRSRIEVNAAPIMDSLGKEVSPDDADVNANDD